MKDEKKKRLVSFRSKVKASKKQADRLRDAVLPLVFAQMCKDVKCAECGKAIDLDAALPDNIPEPLRSAIVGGLGAVFTFGDGSIICKECSPPKEEDEAGLS